jgi:uncharacterized protein
LEGRFVTREPRFLTADWRRLAMLNYEIDPSLLAGYVPAGCELDSWAGRTFMSVVGFQFLHTRVLGVSVPFHRNFEEVNLRFYVRRKVEDTWRRGVVFVKELVPRRAIAWVARQVYGENYVFLPMRHSVDMTAHASSVTLAYQWHRLGAWEGLSVRFSGSPTLPLDDAEETFISEHYWGYSRQRDGTTMEYRVEHPRWRVWRAATASLHCEVTSLYGSKFVEALSASASTAFVAEGSSVVVCRGNRLG